MRLRMYGMVMSVPWDRSHPARLQLRVASIKALRPILARRLYAFIERGAPPPSYDKCEATKGFDGQWIAVLRHTEHVACKDLLFLGVEILLLRCLITSSTSAVLAMPLGGGWEDIRCVVVFMSGWRASTSLLTTCHVSVYARELRRRARRGLNVPGARR